MAILIGVIALAVIPNIQRSRESKDLTTLDNIMSACNVAAANAQLKAGEKAIVEYDGTTGALSFGTGTSAAFQKQYKNAIGEGPQTLSSGVGSTKKITGQVEITASNVASIKVFADGSPTLKYTTNDDGSDKKLEVSSGTATTNP